MMDKLGAYKDEIAGHVSRKEAEKPDKYARVHEPGDETEDRGVDSNAGRGHVCNVLIEDLC